MAQKIEGPLLQSAAHCEPILRALPEWFGIAEANQHYLTEIDKLSTFIARIDEVPVGFLTIQQHFPEAAEIFVMGVQPKNHRQGIGVKLLRAAENYLRQEGSSYLQVKTLSPAHPDPGYAKTRQFYLAMGFVPLEEFPALWDESNPCLLLVKRI